MARDPVGLPKDRVRDLTSEGGAEEEFLRRHVCLSGCRNPATPKLHARIHELEYVIEYALVPINARGGSSYTANALSPSPRAVAKGRRDRAPYSPARGVTVPPQLKPGRSAGREYRRTRHSRRRRRLRFEAAVRVGGSGRRLVAAGRGHLCSRRISLPLSSGLAVRSPLVSKHRS